MSPNTRPRFFTVFMVALTLGAILLGGLIEITFRVQIHRTADRIKQTELEIADLSRHLQLLNTRIAEAQHPDLLMERIGGRMHRPADRNVVWVSDPDGYGITFSPGNDVAGRSLTRAANVP